MKASTDLLSGENPLPVHGQHLFTVVGEATELPGASVFKSTNLIYKGSTLMIKSPHKLSTS